MKRNDNRGFSLVELIVSFAILIILAAAVMQFVVAGSRSYRSVSSSVNVQTSSQLTLSQIEEYVIDCNGGLCYEDDTLYIINSENGGYVAHVFRFDAADGIIYYGTGAVAAASAAPDAEDYLAANVLSFGFTAYPPGGRTDAAPVFGESMEAGSASLTLTVRISEREYDAGRLVALRNRPVTADSFAQLLAAVCR